jgi:ribosomal protein L11 methyltransferase
VCCDTDPLAVEATRANAAANELGQRVTTQLGSLPSRPSGSPYPLVLANLVAAVLIDLAEPLAAHTAPGGTLIASGIIDGRADEVLAAFAASNLVVERRLDDGEWTSLRLRRADR